MADANSRGGGRVGAQGSQLGHHRDQARVVSQESVPLEEAEEEVRGHARRVVVASAPNSWRVAGVTQECPARRKRDGLGHRGGLVLV